MNPPRPPPAEAPREEPGLARPLLVLLALTCAATVANIYYNQPLLPEIARGLAVPPGRVGLVTTLTQFGYAVGLFLLVPLGDAADVRRLVTRLMLVAALGLGAISLAPDLAFMLAASLAMGVATVIPQILIPFAARLAGPGRQGTALGVLQGGVLLGIMGARVFSGLVGQLFGWRAMYLVAGAMMVVLVVALAKTLPATPSGPKTPYRELLASLWRLVAAEPALRQASLLGGLVFAAFSAVWTTLAFFLATPPYHYGSSVAGMFGLVSVVSVVLAPRVGIMADLRGTRVTSGIAVTATALGFAALALVGRELGGLVLGVLLLDVGLSANQVSNQTRVMTLRPDAASRANTVYMVAMFLGGAAGSALGAMSWERWGWPGVWGLGLVLVLLIAGAFARGARVRVAEA